MRRQATVARAVTVQGPGLHTGISSRVSIEPAPPGHGRVFVRADLPDPLPIPAQAAWVGDTRLATTLEREGQRVQTVEHLLATLSALGLDNVLVRLWGPEVPGVDGSARPWLQLLLDAGRLAQDLLCVPLVLAAPVELRDGPRWACCEPASTLELEVGIDFPHPALRKRRLALRFGSRSFERDIAWARTFATQEQAEAMRRAGLARGGSLDNALVLGPAGVINPGGMRGADEPVRHKALDLLGDLALLGRPLVARVRIEQPGHAFNLALVGAILAASGDEA